MKHNNISIFVAHVGCPNKCSFCNQHTISGSPKAPSIQEVENICRKALSEIKNPENTEIAFFGGSFTAISPDYMTDLLRTAYKFIGAGKFHGIRVSTRPDCITPEILGILKEYGVTAIELGAQSMNDNVLSLNERGHTTQDIFNASRMIREYGFELGLQMMIGLYGSTPETEHETMNKIIEIKPDTVRIYPVVILKGTRLAELFETGIFKPFDFEYVVEFSAECLINFERNNIKVIKCGLHASEFVENDKVGGFYHPAFRELCESVIYRRAIQDITGNNSGKYIFRVNDRCISKALGQKKSNIEFFRKNNMEIKFIPDSSVPVYEVWEVK
ncbi:MAG: radical SAM protein [Ruminococcus sp.]|nr:radical SAM protein [Ruminococcus sp.]